MGDRDRDFVYEIHEVCSASDALLGSRASSFEAANPAVDVATLLALDDEDPISLILLPFHYWGAVRPWSFPHNLRYNDVITEVVGVKG